MRGFAVAAGGWDEIEEPAVAPLHLVEPDDRTPGHELATAAVVDLAAHRERREAPANEPEAVILAW